jgi:hypothetical protein
MNDNERNKTLSKKTFGPMLRMRNIFSPLEVAEG